MEWSALAIIAGLIINALVVAFGYGSLTQKVRNLESKGKENKDSIDANKISAEHSIDTKSHIVLAECQNTFRELGSGISELKGKMDMLSTLILNGGKK